MVYTVTTFRCELSLTSHRQRFFRNLLSPMSPIQPKKGSARVISYINNHLEGYISTGRPVRNKSTCDSFWRWQQQCSFPPVTSVHFWITNENSTFHVPRLSTSLSVSLVLMGLDDSTHARYEWMKIGKRERGTDREHLVKKRGEETWRQVSSASWVLILWRFLACTRSSLFYLFWFVWRLCRHHSLQYGVDGKTISE